MTVSQSIITWLKKFNPEDYWKMKSIDTDVMHGEVDYALVKEPTINVKKFLSGKEIHTEFYQINARLDSQTNSDCIDNGAWLEQLTEWISSNNKNEVFPILEVGKVQEIAVSSSFYLGKQIETNKALYQMTIYIKYVKEN